MDLGALRLLRAISKRTRLEKQTLFIELLKNRSYTMAKENIQYYGNN